MYIKFRNCVIYSLIFTFIFTIPSNKVLADDNTNTSKVNQISKDKRTVLIDNKDLNIDSIKQKHENVEVILNYSEFNKMDNQKQNELKQYLDDSINEYKVVSLFNGDGKALDVNESLEDIGQYTNAKVEFPNELAQEYEKNLISVSISKNSNGSTQISMYFNMDDNNINKEDAIIAADELCETSLINGDNTLDILPKKTYEAQAINDSDYNHVFNAFFAWSGGEYGRFQSVTSINRVRKGSTTSYWDVKGSNTTNMGDCSWGTDYLYTRYSVEKFSAEGVIDHAPTTTNGSTQVSCSLDSSGIVGTSWSFSLPDVKCIDLYTPPKYARWKFDYTRGVDSARFSCVTKPGARFTNTKGNFAVEVSHNHGMYKSKLFTTETNNKLTSALRYVVKDR